MHLSRRQRTWEKKDAWGGIEMKEKETLTNRKAERERKRVSEHARERQQKKKR